MEPQEMITKISFGAIVDRNFAPILPIRPEESPRGNDLAPPPPRNRFQIQNGTGFDAEDGGSPDGGCQRMGPLPYMTTEFVLHATPFVRWVEGVAMVEMSR
jgi:hypothetical protein